EVEDDRALLLLQAREQLLGGRLRVGRVPRLGEELSCRDGDRERSELRCTIQPTLQNTHCLGDLRPERQSCAEIGDLRGDLLQRLARAGARNLAIQRLRRERILQFPALALPSVGEIPIASREDPRVIVRWWRLTGLRGVDAPGQLLHPAQQYFLGAL